MTIEERAAQLLEAARAARASAQDWIALNNAIFGIGGPLARMFPTREDRVALSKTAAYKEISDMVSAMRAERGDPDPIAELAAKANGAISVRLPRTVHAALLAEAEAEGVSLNQLCVAKLCVQLRAILS